MQIRGVRGLKHPLSFGGMNIRVVQAQYATHKIGSSQTELVHVHRLRTDNTSIANEFVQLRRNLML
jgi:hypothetical protein